MSKTVILVLAVLSLVLFATPSQAQLIPNGNVYVGAAYADSVDVVNRYTFRGWNASFEDLPFARYSHVGVVLDGSGFYRYGVQQYNVFVGPRISFTFGKWRPFVQVMGGAQRMTSAGTTHYPIAEDAGAGADYKLPFKHFSWRFQFDYMHTQLLHATQNDVRGSTGIVWRF